MFGWRVPPSEEWSKTDPVLGVTVTYEIPDPRRTVRMSPDELRTLLAEAGYSPSPKSEQTR